MRISLIILLPGTSLAIYPSQRAQVTRPRRAATSEEGGSGEGRSTIPRNPEVNDNPVTTDRDNLKRLLADMPIEADLIKNYACAQPFQDNRV